MKSSQLLWLPVQPLVSALTADSFQLTYQIKTLVVSAQASLEVQAGVVRVRASAKIPFKNSFKYECDVESGAVGPFQFSKFRESHGDEWRVGIATTEGLRIDEKQLVEVPAGVATVVALAQSPYVLRGAGDFERAYLGLLVGRHPHIVRFERQSAGRYKIAALGLKHDDVVDDPARLDWSRAHGAEIKVSEGWIDEIRVALPLIGSVTIQRKR